MRDIDTFVRWLLRLLVVVIVLGVLSALRGLLVDYGSQNGVNDHEPSASQPIASLLVGMLIGLVVCGVLALVKGKWRF